MQYVYAKRNPAFCRAQPQRCANERLCNWPSELSLNFLNVLFCPDSPVAPDYTKKGHSSVAFTPKLESSTSTNKRGVKSVYPSSRTQEKSTPTPTNSLCTVESPSCVVYMLVGRIHERLKNLHDFLCSKIQLWYLVLLYYL